MAEEQRLQESHRLCANNCGFFGSSATLNLCSKCYRDHQHKENHAASAKLALQNSLQPIEALPSSSSSPSSVLTTEMSCAVVGEMNPIDLGRKEEAVAVTFSSANSNRCFVCRRKVGLTGFNCRCGPTFCGSHRYPEQHSCGFDFKGQGREAIARANPVVKGQKLDHKI